MQQDNKSIVLNRRFAAFENVDGHIPDLNSPETWRNGEAYPKIGGKILCGMLCRCVPAFAHKIQHILPTLALSNRLKGSKVTPYSQLIA